MQFLQEFLEKAENLKMRRKRVVKNASILSEFDKIQWKLPSDRNLFFLLKILAENGKITMLDIINMEGKEVKLENRRRVWHRLINGKYYNGKYSKQPDNLVNRGIIIISRTEQDMNYELSVFGIFLAIKFFIEDPFGLSKDSYQKKKSKREKSSKQQLDFLSKIAKNYKHIVPLIFDHFDELKERGIDLSLLQHSIMFDKNRGSYLELHPHGIHSLTFLQGFTAKFQSAELQISALFYHRVIVNQWPNLKKLLKNTDLRKFIKYLLDYLEISDQLNQYDTLQKRAYILDEYNKKDISKRFQKTRVKLGDMKPFSH